MIYIELGTPKHFNPENVDAIALNNILLKDEIERQVRKKTKEINWAVNMVYKNKQPKLIQEKIVVDNENCKATYKFVYSLASRETFILEILEWGNEYDYTITIKNKNLIEYIPVKNNHVRKFPDDLSDTVKHSVDIYNIIKSILK